MKSKIIITILILIAGTFINAKAQSIEQDAKHCIHRTGLVILESQRAVKQGKVYTGDLARAIAHQRFAKKQFEQGKYLDAIRQSIRARRLAFAAIQANKGVIRAEWKLDEIESKYEKGMPTDHQLDAAVPGYGGKQNDQDVVGADIKDVNLEEK